MNNLDGNENANRSFSSSDIEVMIIGTELVSIAIFFSFKACDLPRECFVYSTRAQ